MFLSSVDSKKLFIFLNRNISLNLLGKSELIKDDDLERATQQTWVIKESNTFLIVVKSLSSE